MKKAIWFLAAALILSLSSWLFISESNKKNFRRTFGINPEPRSESVMTVVTRVLQEKQGECGSRQTEFRTAADNKAVAVKELKRFQDQEERACEVWYDAISLAEKYSYRR